jgi:glycosyltransferase involved in cell wall biosynthesis
VSASDLVSVVVPSYGHAAHLEEALRSVAAQDHGPLELIVVDDASPDASAEVARRVLADPAFASRFEGRAQLIAHERNLGAHAAINTGLGLASGAYLTILNSDDAYAPARLSALVAELRDRGAALAFSRVAFLGEGGTAPDDAERFRLRRHQDAIPRHPSLGFACLCSNVALTTGNLFFSRALWEVVGPFAALRYCHDWDWLLRAVAIAEPAWVEAPLYAYRMHAGNSYLGLADVAESETSAVLGGYFRSVRSGSIRNPIAPSPERWPGVFEHVMSANGFWRHW